MKRPMLFVATLYLAGIVLANGVAAHGGLLPFWPLLICTMIAAIGAAFWSKVRTGLLDLTLVLAGAANFWLVTDLLSPIDIRRQSSAAPQLFTIRGRLLETPLHRIYSHQDEVTHRTQAEIQLEAIRMENSDWQPAFGVVAVSTSGNLGPAYFSGLRVEIEGVLRAPAGPGAPGAFDYAAYLRRHGVHRQMQCSIDDWRKVDPMSQVPIADRFAAWARAALARGLPEEDQPLQLLWAMVLRWRHALRGEDSEPFMRSGTMHVFAISGLHIALIAWILVAALRVCRMPRRYCALLVIPLIWL